MNYVQEVLLAVTFCFSIVTLIVGVVMLIAPHKLHALAARLDVTISTEKYFDAFDKTKYVDRYFYKYHIIFGIFIILAAVYTAYILLSSSVPYHVFPEIVNFVVSE